VLYKAYRTLGDAMALWLDQFHLTATEWACIGILLRGNTSPSQMAEILQVTPPMVTKIIGKLSHFQLVERLDNKTDKRAVVIRLTPQGVATASDIDQVIRAGMKRLMSGVSPEHMEAYLSVLHYLAELPTPK
jgi:MarR family transcriptional regulator for hemolysin